MRRTGDGARRGRSDAIALLGLVVASLVSLIWLVHPHFDFARDGAIYLVTARSLLAGEGYSYLGEPFTLRPPGFPVLLLPLLALRGTDFLVLNWYVAVFGVACVAVLFCYARRRIELLPALAVAVAVWLNPSFERFRTQVMSDVPGSVWLIACLALEPWARKRPFPARDLLLGLLIGVATYIRSIHILLVPAIVLARILHRRRESPGLPARRFVLRNLAVLVAVPLLAILPWSLRNASNAPVGPVDQVWVHSYWVGMWHADSTDPDSPRIGVPELVKRARERGGVLLALLGSRLESSVPDASNVLAGVVGLGCWLVVLLRRREPGEFFVGGALAVLLFYFAFRDRLMLPVYLLVLPAVAEVLFRGLAALVGSRWSAGTAAICVLALGIHDFTPRPGWPEIEVGHRERARVAAYLDEALPPEVPVASLDGPRYAAYLDRRVYSLGAAIARRGMTRAFEIIDRYGIRAIVIEEGRRRGLRLLWALGNSDIRVVSVGPVKVVHVEKLGLPRQPIE